jgi:hypothetical protein
MAVAGILVTLAGPGRAADNPEDNRQHSGASVEEIRKWIGQLGDDSFAVRERASQRLTALGRPTLPLLQQALQSSDLEVRYRARHIEEMIRTSLGYLLDNLKDSDPNTRKSAAEALEHLGEGARAAVPYLRQALTDPEETVRDAAVSALLVIDSDDKTVADLLPAEARGSGKYKTLLRRIHVPADRNHYQNYRDWGFFQGSQWAGHKNLPAGYWVYVYPYWYIWRDRIP